MVRVSHLHRCACGLVVLWLTQSFSLTFGQTSNSAQARMRPIGSPSAVDQYRTPQPTQPTGIRETAYQFPVRQAAMLQNELTPPPLSNQPGVPITLPTNPGGQPLPTNRSLPTQPATGGTDLAPMPQPQLRSAFATVDNCNLVSPPSNYSAAYGIGCGQNGYVTPQSYAAQPQTFQAPPAQIAAPAVMPGVRPAYAGAPMRSLFTLGQENFPVQVGQGLLGQPVAYVPGQPLRNWLRYLFP